VFARALFPTDFSAYANAVFACLPELRAAGRREVGCLALPGTKRYRSARPSSLIRSRRSGGVLKEKR